MPGCNENSARPCTAGAEAPCRSLDVRRSESFCRPGVPAVIVSCRGGTGRRRAAAVAGRLFRGSRSRRAPPAPSRLRYVTRTNISASHATSTRCRWSGVWRGASTEAVWSGCSTRSSFSATIFSTKRSPRCWRRSSAPAGICCSTRSCRYLCRLRESGAEGTTRRSFWRGRCRGGLVSRARWRCWAGRRMVRLSRPSRSVSVRPMSGMPFPRRRLPAGDRFCSSTTSAPPGRHSGRAPSHCRTQGRRESVRPSLRKPREAPSILRCRLSQRPHGTGCSGALRPHVECRPSSGAGSRYKAEKSCFEQSSSHFPRAP
jgi:hypothetical protein